MNPEETAWKEPTTVYHSLYNLRVFGYVDMMCIALGMVFNTFVVLVFTRKAMVSPMNTIFIHIAIAETLSSLCYLPRAWQEYIRAEECLIHIYRTYGWEITAVYSYVVACVFRHVVVWLTVMLGVWRYIAVVHPLKKKQLCDIRITRRLIIAGYIFGFLITIPPYIITAALPSTVLLDGDGCITSNLTIGHKTTIYKYNITLESNPVVYSFLAIVYGIFIKSLPSIVLTAISYKLIVALIEARKRRAVMVANLNRKHTEKQTDRTTIILLLILALFIATEIPHGICLILVGILGKEFFWAYYYYIIEVANCFAAISQTLNFVFYYTMSDQFRKTFKTLLKQSGYTSGSSQTGHHINSATQVSKRCQNEVECLV